MTTKRRNIILALVIITLCAAQLACTVTVDTTDAGNDVTDVAETVVESHAAPNPISRAVRTVWDWAVDTHTEE